MREVRSQTFPVGLVMVNMPAGVCGERGLFVEVCDMLSSGLKKWIGYFVLSWGRFRVECLWCGPGSEWRLHGHLLGDGDRLCFEEGFYEAFLTGPFSGSFDAGGVFGWLE